VQPNNFILKNIVKTTTKKFKKTQEIYLYKNCDKIFKKAFVKKGFMMLNEIIMHISCRSLKLSHQIGKLAWMIVKMLWFSIFIFNCVNFPILV